MARSRRRETKFNKATLTSRNGFYVGDLCYFLGNTRRLWGDRRYRRTAIIADYKKDLKFCQWWTAWGDGTYKDNKGRRYPVDSGTLGIAPLELADGDYFYTEGVVCQGDKATFESVDGKFHIVIYLEGKVLEDITIDTIY